MKSTIVGSDGSCNCQADSMRERERGMMTPSSFSSDVTAINKSTSQSHMRAGLVKDQK